MDITFRKAQNDIPMVGTDRQLFSTGKDINFFFKAENMHYIQ